MKAKIATAVIVCLAVALVIACSKTGANNYPSVDEATSVLNQAVAYAQSRDIEGLGRLSQDKSMASIILNNIGGWQTVPTDPPQIVNTYILPTVQLKSGGEATGGRVLVLQGTNGLGKPYQTQFLVFRAGSQFGVINVIYWDGFSVGQPNEYGLATIAPSPTATTVASEYSFIPGNVLAGLPVYPGATPTTFLDSGAPVSVPFSRSILIGSLRPGYQSASAQYSVKAYDHDIMNWYVNELSTKGYRLYGGVSTFSMGTVGGEEIAFFLPSQPLVSVEVHLYDMAGETVLELLVTYSVPLPKPPEENLPDDIDSITATYFSGNLTTVKTITDSQTITQLVSMVNNLPVRPDYVYLCPIGVETRTIFSLVFHSQSKGNITVSDVIGCQVGGIYMGDYPILEDTHGLLREAVEQILGISST